MHARALAKAAAAAITLFIVAVALSALLFRERGPAAPREAPEPAARTAEPDARLAPVGEPAADPALAAGGEPGSASVPDAARKLRGTLVLVDTEGGEHAEEDGEFLILRSAHGEEPLPVVVTGGKWEARWTAAVLPEQLWVMQVRARGEAARADNPFPVPADAGEIPIRARWESAPLVIEVIGKDTGKGLEGITLLASEERWSGPSPHTGGFGPEQVLVEGAKSPVTLETSPLDERRLQGEGKIWAWAPGRAWCSTVVDFDEGGERLIVLDRGATLEVALLDPPAAREGEKPARIRLREASKSSDVQDVVEEIKKTLEQLGPGSEGERPVEEEIAALRDRQRRLERGCAGRVHADVAPRAGEITRIDGVVAGSFTVCVEIGESYKHPLVLGSEPVELAAGETTRVTIRMEKRPDAAAKVPFAGTIHIPEAWEVGTVSLSIEPLEMPELDLDQLDPDVREIPGRPGMHRWSAGKVPPGKYVLVLYAFELQHVVDVPPEGKLDAHISVGDPVEGRVKVVDAATGEDLKDAEVSWHCQWPAGVTGGSLEGAKYDEETGDHVFKAPAGPINICVDSEQHVHVKQVLQLAPGQQPITIALKKACGVLLSVEGSRLAGLDELDDRIELKSVSGQGRVVKQAFEPLKFFLDQPGVYELHMPGLDGFRPVPPAMIRVPPGEFVEHTVVLERE